MEDPFSITREATRGYMMIQRVKRLHEDALGYMKLHSVT